MNNKLYVNKRIRDFFFDKAFLQFLNKDEVTENIYKIKVAYGGRSAGKTKGVVNEILDKMSLYYINILVFRDYKTSTQDSIKNTIENTITSCGVSDAFDITAMRILCNNTRSKIVFSGYELDPDSIKGTEDYDIIIFEECHNLQKRTYDVIVPTFMRKRCSQMWFLFNPANETDFITRLYVLKDLPDPNTDVTDILYLTYKDNPFLDEVAIKSITNTEKVDKEGYEHIYLGIPLPAVSNAIFGNEIKFLRENNRITNVKHMANFPVIATFDLGYADYTAIWFIQEVNNDIRVIDFLYDNRHTIEFYFNVMNKLPYQYRTIILPHDAKSKNTSCGENTIYVKAKRFFVNSKIEVLKRPQNTRTRIDALRNVLRLMYFDIDKCQEGLKFLARYHYESSKDGRFTSKEPKHDLNSHAADSLTYYGQFKNVKKGQYLNMMNNNKIEYNSNDYKEPYIGKVTFLTDSF